MEVVSDEDEQWGETAAASPLPVGHKPHTGGVKPHCATFSNIANTHPVLRSPQIPKYIFGIGALALAVPIFTSNYTAIMLGFLVFEGCVGMYFPSMGTLKSKIVH